MQELNVTEALLMAILELADKCETLDEFKKSVEEIMNAK